MRLLDFQGLEETVVSLDLHVENNKNYTENGETTLSITSDSLLKAKGKEKKNVMDDMLQTQQNEVKKKENAMEDSVNGTRIPVMEVDREIGNSSSTKGR